LIKCSRRVAHKTRMEGAFSARVLAHNSRKRSLNEIKMEGKQYMNRTELGRFGERLALEYLNNKGYNTVALNYRVGRLGEIDIIVSKEGRICFVEVKTRTGTSFGTPAEAVSWKKQNTIRRIAACFLKAHNAMDSRVQFDVIEVIAGKNGEFNKINHIQEAF